MKRLLIKLGIIKPIVLDSSSLREVLANYNRMDRNKAWYNQDNDYIYSNAVFKVE